MNKNSKVTDENFHECLWWAYGTASFLNVFLSIKNGSPVFFDCIEIPNFDGSNDIFPNSTDPWPRLQNGWKISG